MRVSQLIGGKLKQQHRTGQQECVCVCVSVCVCVFERDAGNDRINTDGEISWIK